MKRVMRFLALAVIAAAALLFFAPKENLYYLAEKKMAAYGIVFSGEALHERATALRVERAELYVKEVQSASIEQADIICLGLYNRVDARGVRLAPAFEQLFPGSIETVTLTYTVFDPLHLIAAAAGDFGTAEARISLRDRMARVVMTPSQLVTTRYAHMLGNFSRDETGGYVYEYRF